MYEEENEDVEKDNSGYYSDGRKKGIRKIIDEVP
jgi:hypothetical protein